MTRRPIAAIEHFFQMSPPAHPARGRPAALIPLGVIVGVATAVAVWLFKQLIALVAWAAYGWHASLWTEVALPLVVIIPVIGGLAVGLILHRFRVPEEPGHGVTEVIEAVTLDIQEIPYRQTPVKAPVAALSLGTGASLGPEDPAVEIGGSIGEFVGIRGRLPHEAVKTLIASGAAAGISAAFHAPLAAILFTAEVLAVRVLSKRMGYAALASIVAYLAIRLVAPETVLRIPAYEIPDLAQVGLALGLGALAGIVAAGQIRLMYTVEHAFLAWRTPPRWMKPALGGLALGGVGAFLPEVLGIGYGTIQAIIQGDVTAQGVLLALVLGKLILMAVSFGSGFVGGFFAPSLFAGAALGGLFGAGAGIVLPGLEPDPTTFAVAGMAAVLAGLVHAPLTAVLLVIAVSDNYALVPLLLAAALASYLVSRALERDSLYMYAFDHPAPEPPDDGNGRLPTFRG